MLGYNNKTKFEKNLEWAQEKEKIVYYDYLNYKRGAGWWTGVRNDDWHRPTIIKKAKYQGEFLNSLLDYYFLGLPIKELLKTCCSNGYCHACSIALSFYFNDFEIITCNLRNYQEHYAVKTNDVSVIDEYEHTFLLVDLENERTVIDTTFGFITDWETYKFIFNPNKIRTITSEQLKSVDAYQYIRLLKDYKMDLNCFQEKYLKENNERIKTFDEKEFDEIICKYMDMCKNYTNNENFHLQDFINRCLLKNSNSNSCWHLKVYIEYKSELEYPKMSLSSLVDDEFDERLDGVYKDTIERNKRVLENYHNEQVESQSNNKNKLKSKIFRFLKEKR